jgi:hypothetical protein
MKKVQGHLEKLESRCCLSSNFCLGLIISKGGMQSECNSRVWVQGGIDELQLSPYPEISLDKESQSFNLQSDIEASDRS